MHFSRTLGPIVIFVLSTTVMVDCALWRTHSPQRFVEQDERLRSPQKQNKQANTISISASKKSKRRKGEHKASNPRHSPYHICVHKTLREFPDWKNYRKLRPRKVSALQPWDLLFYKDAQGHFHAGVVLATKQSLLHYTTSHTTESRVLSTISPYLFVLRKPKSISATKRLTLYQRSSPIYSKRVQKRIRVRSKGRVGSWFYPLRKFAITSPYGWRILRSYRGRKRWHPAVDLSAPKGTPVFAARAGRVLRAGWMGYCGYAVLLQHPNRYRSLYCHLSQIFVTPKRTVRGGQRIGLVGSTGNSSGPHLHFALYYARKAIHPLQHLILRDAQLP